MVRLRFSQLPLAVKIAVALVFNNVWWSIEEFVIDRHGIWKYMPGYRVADPCVWDLGVALLTTAAVLWASIGRRKTNEVHQEA